MQFILTASSSLCMDGLRMNFVIYNLVSNHELIDYVWISFLIRIIIVLIQDYFIYVTYLNSTNLSMD